ncbi:hypothetical protein GCM10027425_14060 [Alteromonas gracilis]
MAAHYERLNRRRRKRLTMVLDPAQEKKLIGRFALGQAVAGLTFFSQGGMSRLSQQGFTWTHLDIGHAFRRLVEDSQSPDPRVRTSAEQTIARVSPWMNVLLVPGNTRPKIPDFTPEHDWVLYSVAEHLVAINAPVR